MMKQKMKSYNLGQLRGAWGAGMAMSPKNDPLINMFFHELNEKGEIKREGMIVKKYRDDEYFIKIVDFCCLHLSYQRRIISFKDKAKFLFYDNAKEMRFSFASLSNWDEKAINGMESWVRMHRDFDMKGYEKITDILI